MTTHPFTMQHVVYVDGRSRPSTNPPSDGVRHTGKQSRSDPSGQGQWVCVLEASALSDVDTRLLLDGDDR